MKNRILAILATIFLLLIANSCSTNQSKQPASQGTPEILGRVRLTVNAIGGQVTSSHLKVIDSLDTQDFNGVPGFQQADFSKKAVETFVVAEKRYINVVYLINNRNTTTYDNLVLLAVDTASTEGVSPFSNIKNYGGGAITDATKVPGAIELKADKAYKYSHSTNAATLSESDGYVTNLAVTNPILAQGETALTYGYRAFKYGDPTQKTIPVSDGNNTTAEGQVSFSSSFKAQAQSANDPFSYSVDFVIVNQPTNASSGSPKTVLKETFTDPSNPTFQSSITPFITGSFVNDQFFHVITPSAMNVTTSYQVQNMNGNYFATMASNGNGDPLPVHLLWDDLDISNLNSLELSLLIAEDDDGLNESWEGSDYVVIEYDIDNSGTFTPLLKFQGGQNASDGNVSPPFIDGNGNTKRDGTEVVLTSSAQVFTRQITNTGSTLDLRIRFNLNGANEDVAIDDVTIEGITQ